MLSAGQVDLLTERIAHLYCPSLIYPECATPCWAADATTFCMLQNNALQTLDFSYTCASQCSVSGQLTNDLHLCALECNDPTWISVLRIEEASGDMSKVCARREADVFNPLGARRN